MNVLWRVGRKDAGIKAMRAVKMLAPDLTHKALHRLLRKGHVKIVLDGKDAASPSVPGRKAFQSTLPEGALLKGDAVACSLMGMEEEEEEKEEKGGKIREAMGIELEQMVVYEDDEVVVLDKPAGYTCQGGSGDRNLVGMMATAWGKRAVRSVHRLDKGTSGLVLFGRTREGADHAARAFRDGSVEKGYQAIVSGPGVEGLDVGASVDVDRPLEGKDARTVFEVLEKGEEGAVWVQATPVVGGRKHQIRRHAARGLDACIVGDVQYGSHVDLAPYPGFLLHASRLVLPSMDGVVWESDVPGVFYDVMSGAVSGSTST